MNNVTNIIKLALKEDRACNDVTSRATIPANQFITANFVARENGVVCGIDVAGVVFKALDARCRMKILLGDGKKAAKGKTIARIIGPARAILSGERTALNFMQRLSGVATLTRKYVEKVKGTKAKILDTRKTTPGLRSLEKYAVVCGGGTNHRMDLSEMALLKDNHIGSVGDIRLAVGKIKRLGKRVKIEVECDTLVQLDEALAAGADIVMLDNMSVPMVRKAIKIVEEYKKRSGKQLPQTEVSGGINLSTVKQYARLGCDRISVGALTHSAPALDISLDIIEQKVKGEG